MYEVYQWSVWKIKKKHCFTMYSMKKGYKYPLYVSHILHTLRAYTWNSSTGLQWVQKVTGTCCSLLENSMHTSQLPIMQSNITGSNINCFTHLSHRQVVWYTIQHSDLFTCYVKHNKHKGTLRDQLLTPIILKLEFVSLELKGANRLLQVLTKRSKLWSPIIIDL